MSERGSIILGTLFLAMIISLCLGNLVYQVGVSRQSTIRSAAKTNAQDMQTDLQMIMSKTSTCSANLTATAFGTTMAELSTRSNAGLTFVIVPNPVPAGPAATLMPGAVFGKFQINKISFSTATQLFAPDPAWVADLIFVVTPFGSTIVRNIVIPFYFETDPAGTLISCFASGRPAFTGLAAGLTLEDELCAHWRGPQFRYRYAGRFCSVLP